MVSCTSVCPPGVTRRTARSDYTLMRPPPPGCRRSARARTSHSRDRSSPSVLRPLTAIRTAGRRLVPASTAPLPAILPGSWRAAGARCLKPDANRAVPADHLVDTGHRRHRGGRIGAHRHRRGCVGGIAPIHRPNVPRSIGNATVGTVERLVVEPPWDQWLKSAMPVERQFRRVADDDLSAAQARLTRSWPSTAAAAATLRDSRRPRTSPARRRSLPTAAGSPWSPARVRSM